MRRFDSAHEIITIQQIHRKCMLDTAISHNPITNPMNEFYRELSEHPSLNFGESRKHGIGVAMLASALGSFIKLPELDCSKLRLAGVLHDIGKTKVPRELLQKTDRLSEHELKEVKRHVQYGFEIMHQMHGTAMGEIAQVALFHHEHWDGTGYPQGIAENEIPFMARLVSIVDVYDAMTTDRVYRKAHSHLEAVNWIVSNSGKHFDPEIATAFVAMSNELGMFSQLPV